MDSVQPFPLYLDNQRCHDHPSSLRAAYAVYGPVRFSYIYTKSRARIYATSRPLLSQMTTSKSTANPLSPDFTRGPDNHRYEHLTQNRLDLTFNLQSTCVSPESSAAIEELTCDEQFKLVCPPFACEDPVPATIELLDRIKNCSLTDLDGRFKVEITKEGRGAERDPTVSGLLKRINGSTLTELQAVNIRPLDRILNEPVRANLSRLDLAAIGTLHVFGGLLAAANPDDPLFPKLKQLRFVIVTVEVLRSLGDDLLKLLRNCPWLETAFFEYGDPEQVIKFTTNDLVSLPHLVEFTHESPNRTVPIGLRERLSLPKSTTVKLIALIKGKKCEIKPSECLEPDPEQTLRTVGGVYIERLKALFAGGT